MMIMLESCSGNLLEAEVEALVNTVNCVGVMGKGLALQFKQAFPENFQEYRRACQSGEVKPGQMLIVPTGRLTTPATSSTSPPNAIGKIHPALKILKLGFWR